MNATGIRIASQGALIQCPRCDKRILDGNVLLARVVVIGLRDSQAKCPRCKHMVTVPLTFALPRT